MARTNIIYEWCSDYDYYNVNYYYLNNSFYQYTDCPTTIYSFTGMSWKIIFFKYVFFPKKKKYNVLNYKVKKLYFMKNYLN